MLLVMCLFAGCADVISGRHNWAIHLTTGGNSCVPSYSTPFLAKMQTLEIETEINAEIVLKKTGHKPFGECSLDSFYQASQGE